MSGEAEPISPEPVSPEPISPELLHAQRWAAAAPLREATDQEALRFVLSSIEPGTWDVGRSTGRSLYIQIGPQRSKADLMVGTMDSPVLAQLVADAVNDWWLGVQPAQTDPLSARELLRAVRRSLSRAVELLWDGQRERAERLLELEHQVRQVEVRIPQAGAS